jgi:lysophospholipase
MTPEVSVKYNLSSDVAHSSRQAALTKLSYLLSKSELSPAEIRTLLRTPLRGELTPAAVSTTHSPPSANMVGDAMSHIQRLSSSSLHEAVSFVPDDKLKESSAAWSATAADSVSAQAALLPFLMHLAVSRDDVEAVHFCIEADNNSGQVSATPLTELPLTVASGIVNAPDAGSGRSPLHTAALCGSEGSVNLLLTSGALVHLRDSLGHTALYYVIICFSISFRLRAKRQFLGCSEWERQDCTDFSRSRREFGWGRYIRRVCGARGLTGYAAWR